MPSKNPLVLCGLVALAAAVGCEKESATGPSNSGADLHAGATASTDPAPTADDHDHDHAGHGHGESHALGSATVGAFQVAVIQEGEAAPGQEIAFELRVTGAGRAQAVRLWIGLQDGSGSMKSKGEAEEAGFHAHAEVPDPLPDGSKLWIEVEDDQGGTAVGSFELKR